VTILGALTNILGPVVASFPIFADFPMATELRRLLCWGWTGVQSSSLTEGRFEVTRAKKAWPLLDH
jgi:hypothetical protein